MIGVKSKGRSHQIQSNQSLNLLTGIPDDVKLLLITKLGTNVTTESEFIVRGEKQMKESNFEILCLNKSKNSSDRILSNEEQKSNLVIEDSGFKVKN